MPISTLPNEILTHLLCAIDNQADRFSALLVCRNWYKIILPMLYRTPVLSSERAIKRFILAPISLRYLAHRITLPACVEQKGFRFGEVGEKKVYIMVEDEIFEVHPLSIAIIGDHGANENIKYGVCAYLSEQPVNS